MNMLLEYSKLPYLGEGRELTNINLLKIIKSSANHNQNDIMDLVFQHYGNLNITNEDGSCALARATATGNMTLVEKLIKKGADPSFYDENVCSLSEGIQKELNYEVTYNLLSLSAYPHAWVHYFLNYKSNFFHSYFYKDAIETSRARLDDIVEIIFQFGGDANKIYNQVSAGLTCEGASK